MPVEEEEESCFKSYCDSGFEDESEVLEKPQYNEKVKSSYGVMTEVLDDMLKERGINIPYLEAPVKENIESERVKSFMDSLDNLFTLHRDNK